MPDVAQIFFVRVDSYRIVFYIAYKYIYSSWDFFVCVGICLNRFYLYIKSPGRLLVHMCVMQLSCLENQPTSRNSIFHLTTDNDSSVCRRLVATGGRADTYDVDNRLKDRITRVTPILYGLSFIIIVCAIFKRGEHVLFDKSNKNNNK